MKYFKLPLNYSGITESWEAHVERGSRGQDFGWNNAHGGPNVPVYSINDGVVDQVSYNDSCGYYVWIKHSYDNTHDLWSRYLHLKEGSICVKVGQNVNRYQQIGNMGSTGQSTGSHLHFETWLVPKGWKFNWSDRNKYAVRGTDYCYLFDGQEVANDTKALVIRVLGTNNQVKRDTSKDQIEVVGSLLRCRADAGVDKTVYGYIDFGLYNYDATKTASGYTWYHIPSGWIAGTKEDTKVYPKEEPVPPTPDPKDEKIKELEEELAKANLVIKDLETQNEALKKEIDELNEEIEELKKYTDLKVFTAPKEDYYYIYLHEGECVYLKA